MSKRIKKKVGNENKRSAKKAVVLGTERKRRTPVIIAFACAILIAGGAYFYSHPGGKTLPTTASTVGTASDSVVTYPASLFSDGNARHFEHPANDMTIRYFILKSSDGIVRAAFDACDVCWPAGKGYYQEGDYMVCRNCGRRFKSTLINEVKGGCNPAPLNREIIGDQLVIHLDDIVKGKQYFDFSGRV